MLVLLETPAGYAIFKLLDEKKLKHADNLYADFESPEAANKIVKLKHFEKFSDTTEALAAMTAAVEGKVSKPLKKALNKLVDQDVQSQLLVGDAKLGNAIKDKLNFQCVSNTAVNELMRCMRAQYESLLAGLPKKELLAMTLGLSHSLSRYKLKFSPDKIDTMIVQAVSLLDDLDKELNNYIMRCREWYGWHFPELGKLITDNIAFVKTVKSVGTRENAATTELSDILPEDLEEQVKEAAEISMGTEISDVDILNIQNMCDQIIELTAYRAQLYDYLKVRMMAMAPNLTVLVGELVGARLISHSGSLINLAKHPASTVQILGAEKALFRALKTKKDTPKYGLIYHAQLIGQTSTKNKGKMSRMLAAKASLAVRVDALGDGDDSTFELGAEHKAKLEARLRILEEGNLKRISGTGKAKAKFEKYHGISEIKTYPHAADSTLPSGKRKKLDPGTSTEIKEEVEDDTPKQKRKKLKTQMETGIKIESEEAVPKKKSKNKGDVQVEEEAEVAMPKKKKKKRQDVQKEEEIKIEEAEVSMSKKKKKKRQDVEEGVKEKEIKIEEPEQSVPKKKKKKQNVQDEVKVEDTEEFETKKKKKKKFVEKSVTSVDTPEVVKEKKKKKK